MYTPKSFRVHDPKRIQGIIEKNPFATLISIKGAEPCISHLPLVAEFTEDQIKLIGHIAKGNPHAKLLEHGFVTTIFHGPHTYINPNWYEENDVPTWNYVAIHLKGKARLVADFAGTLAALRKLNVHMERLYDEKWDFWLPADLNTEKKLASSIVGFEIEVNEICAKFKLNQNRSKEDIRGVVAGLGKRQDGMSLQVKDLMTELL